MLLVWCLCWDQIIRRIRHSRRRKVFLPLCRPDQWWLLQEHKKSKLFRRDHDIQFFRPMLRPYPRLLHLLWTCLLCFRPEYLFEIEALLWEKGRMGEISKIIIYNFTQGILEFLSQPGLLLNHSNSPFLLPLELVPLLLQWFRLLQQDKLRPLIHCQHLLLMHSNIYHKYQ